MPSIRSAAESAVAEEKAKMAPDASGEASEGKWKDDEFDAKLNKKIRLAQTVIDGDGNKERREAIQDAVYDAIQLLLDRIYELETDNYHAHNGAEKRAAKRHEEKMRIAGLLNLDRELVTMPDGRKILRSVKPQGNG
jgi:hypothetical protein